VSAEGTDSRAAEPIRHAATVILARNSAEGPEVLMGQRGAAAAFMPSKFVFPGGSVDPADAAVPLSRPLDPQCARRLATDAPGAPAPAAFVATAIRELWEEAGLVLGEAGSWQRPPPAGWEALAERGIMPSGARLSFVFRAITPPGRTRRFDARFFLADAGAVAGDPADFSRASDELSHLHWIPVHRARELDLPFITEVVLAEVGRLVGREGPPEGGVPFFDNSGPTPLFRRLL
jgi:8-oxo-dGTP pyrophosphatase MutT (NUDIX family)